MLGAVCAAVITVTGTIMAVPTARAGFPGVNGWIAFENSQTGLQPDYDIFVTRLTDSGWILRRLTNDPAGNRAHDTYAAVSPNGNEVAFSSRRSTEAFPNEGRDVEIYVMDTQDDDGDGFGDDMRRLTDNTAIDVQAAWSPGGKRLAFASNRANLGSNTPTDIYVMDADGSEEPIRLPRDPAASTSQHPVFSPDGEWVVFVGGYVNFEIDLDLFMTRADGSGELIRLTDSVDATNTHPEISPDGTKLAFISNRDVDGDGLREADIDIYVMNLEPEDEANVAVNITNGMIDAITGEETNERIPAWSPDGTSIAFWAGLAAGTNPSTHRPGIWLIAADGTGSPIRITDPAMTAGPIRPDWGPAPTTPSASP
jgi:Tol biopolymer transport system component